MLKAIAQARSVCCALCVAAVLWAGAGLLHATEPGTEPAHAAAASTAHAAEKSGTVNWQSVEHGAPIPHQVPLVTDADTGIAAGFAPQWIQRSIIPWPPIMQDPDLPGRLIQRIANGSRRPDDSWAHQMAARLRDALSMVGNADVLRYARVFCGSQGCLCYYETPLDASSVEAYDHARSSLLHGLLDDNGWGKSFGIAATDVNEVGETGVWELIYILRPKARR
jgi:hypothetical protein